jgi:hypothetical protein
MSTSTPKRTTYAFAIGLAVGIVLYLVVVELVLPMVGN